MNTTVVLWVRWLGLRIERLGQRLCAWSVAKKRQQETDDDGFPVIHLSEKAKKRLAKVSDEIDVGEDLSPAFDNTDDAIAYLHEEARKYKERESGQ